MVIYEDISGCAKGFVTKEIGSVRRGPIGSLRSRSGPTAEPSPRGRAATSACALQLPREKLSKAPFRFYNGKASTELKPTIQASVYDTTE